MEAAVCKHFQTGFCKFQDHCRKHHIQELCETDNCKTKTCTFRHEKVCKFFAKKSVCKFGNKCEYLHKSTNTRLSEIDLLVSKVTSLKNTVKDLSGKIVIPQEIIKTKTSESNLSLNPSYKCDQCGYKAST